VTEADVIALGQMGDVQLRILLPWLARRLSLAESMDRLFQGSTPEASASQIEEWSYWFAREVIKDSNNLLRGCQLPLAPLAT
jgi:hypothetical protein